jgi:tRNA threonylcarbamoyladenosine biosynthesis protein TsaE
MEHGTNTKKMLHAPCPMFRDIYHIDTYRVNSSDILDLGWEEITRDKNNVIIIEWADRVRGIIPKESLWVSFEWVDKNKRKVIFSNN